MVKAPFPGMDPWLEHPGLWMDVHNALMSTLREELIEALPESYFVGLEERIYVAERIEDDFVGRGDVSISVLGRRRENGGLFEGTIDAGAIVVDLPTLDRVRHTFLEVRKPRERRLVTIVEILSPTNKRPGEDRQDYLRKRRSILRSDANLVEIDLLRAWERMPVRRLPRPSDYSILVSRSIRRPRAELLPFGVRDEVPAFHLPLDPGEEEPVLHVGETLHRLYERARYHRVIDYARPPVPPLTAKDRTWANRRLREAKLR